VAEVYQKAPKSRYGFEQFGGFFPKEDTLELLVLSTGDFLEEREALSFSVLKFELLDYHGST
jgi:hypothetical protein